MQYKNIKIEPASPSDAAELLEIYKPYVTDTAISFEYEVPSVDDFKNRIEKISAKYPYIKAVNEAGEIFGYAYAHEFIARAAYDWSVETTIYLRQDAKRGGLGRLLYTELEKELAAMGILNMNACIAVTNKEDEHLTNASKKFHEHMGFEMVGTFHKSGYKFSTWYDMIWMEKLIGAHGPNPRKIGQ